MATYVGSPEHKDTPSFAGHPRPRADASICPSALRKEQSRVTTWLKDAIREGRVGGPLDGQFPRYVWHREQDTVYEGRVVNSELGQYKGYPLNPEEWPRGI